jgi:rRNA maturation endonuclease Nob1
MKGVKLKELNKKKFCKECGIVEIKMVGLNGYCPNCITFRCERCNKTFTEKIDICPICNNPINKIYKNKLFTLNNKGK